MSPEELYRLFDYTYWAFERVWVCIDELTDEQFTQPLDYSIGSIRNHVVHIMSGTQRWIYRIQSKPLSPHLEFDLFPTLSITKEKWNEMREEVLDYIHSLDQYELNNKVRWEIGTRGISQESYRWELLMHLINHATDHRAQILAMLYEHFEVKTIEQDFIFYLAEHP